jgi:hypothetical protein
LIAELGQAPEIDKKNLNQRFFALRKGAKAFSAK